MTLTIVLWIAHKPKKKKKEKLIIQKLLPNSANKFLTSSIKEWSSKACFLCFIFILFIKVNKNIHQHLSELHLFITCNYSGYGYKSSAKINKNLLGKSIGYMEFRKKTLLYVLFVYCALQSFLPVKFIISIYVYVFMKC